MLVYLICNLPKLVLHLVEYQLISEIYKQDQCGSSLEPWWISSLIRSSHLLLTLNGSVNFIIYISFSKGFKKVLISKSLIIWNENKRRYTLTALVLRATSVQQMFEMQATKKLYRRYYLQAGGAKMRRLTFFFINMPKWAGINLSVIPGDGKPTPSCTELHRFSSPSQSELHVK